MGDVGMEGDVHRGAGGWGAVPVGVHFDDLAAAYPEVFAASHPDGSLSVGVAEDLIAAVDHRGRRPEDVAFLRLFVEQSGGAWTEQARRRFQESLFGRHLGQPGLVFFAGGNGQGAVAFPTTEMLLSGRIPAQAFSASLGAVVDGWFDGNPAQVPRPRSVSIKDLRRYLEGESLPTTYREAFAIAGALGVVDPEGLMVAWLADVSATGEPAGIPFLPDDGASSLERQRYEALLRSAFLALRDSEDMLASNDSPLQTPVQAARYARRAMRAGFDTDTVIGVIADYAGTQRGFFDGVFEEAQLYVDAGYEELASTAYWLAAEHSRRHGDHGMAGILFASAADVLRDKAMKKPTSSGFARHEAIQLYERALEEHDLFRQAVLGDAASPDIEDGFRDAVEASIATLEGLEGDPRRGNGSGGPQGGGQAGGPGGEVGPQGTPPAAPGGSEVSAMQSFRGIEVVEDMGAPEAGEPVFDEPSAVGTDPSDPLLTGGANTFGGIGTPLVIPHAGAGIAPVVP